jgi:dihydrolipoamide dehydrogenase
MNPAKSYDLVIIGSGPGGYVAALYASRQNLSVCVIEKDSLGGTCLNRGCIPTKALLHSASLATKIRGCKDFGMSVDGLKIDFPAVAARKDTIVARLKTGIETLFKAGRIDLIKGAARFISADTVTVAGENIHGRNFVIASGSVPAALPGITIDEKRICSSDGILALTEVPRSITVVGGGVIGCEFASLFNALGSKVSIVELLDRILATQSKEVSKKTEVILKKRGISVSTSTRFDLAAATDSDKILVSVGRRPNTEGLGLDAIGVGLEKGRVAVDSNLRTKVKNIYAIGDCVSGPQLAHKASYDGMLAVDNILGGQRAVDYSNIPNCVWTDPEIASVGMTEEEARAAHPDSKVAKFPYIASGKAYIMGKPEGFIKLIGDAAGRILGVEIFGEEACDLIGEAALAREKGVTIKELSRVVHGHPTLSEMYQEAAHIFCGTPIHSI